MLIKKLGPSAKALRVAPRLGLVVSLQLAISDRTCPRIYSGLLSHLRVICRNYFTLLDIFTYYLDMSVEEGWHTVEDGKKLYTKTWKVTKVPDGAGELC